MSKKIFAAAAISAAVLTAGLPAHAVVVVDGKISDWGFTVHNNNTDSVLNLSAYAGPGSFGLLAGTNPALEDNDNTAGAGGQLGPWQGGQRYDSEYMAVALSTPTGGSLSNSSIYVVILTGQRPDNGPTEFGLGDIRIDSGTGHYGIETGGGAGHTGGAPVDVQTQASGGTNYTLDGNGFTTGSSSTPATAGTIYKTSSATTTNRDATNWLLDTLTNDNGSPTAPPASEQDDRNQLNYATLTNGDKVLANMVYRYSADALCADGTLASDHVGNTCASNGGGSVHAVIEMSFDAAPFVTTDLNGDESLVFSVDWGPSCNNDVLEVAVAASQEHSRTNMPEPGTLALLGLGLGGLGLRSRVRRKSAA